MIFDFLDTIIQAPMSYSFPSGHTTSSFAAAASIALLGKKPAFCAFALASLIAFSRIYLSVHYLTDILGGIAMGIASAFIARWIYKKTAPKLKWELWFQSRGGLIVQNNQFQIFFFTSFPCQYSARSFSFHLPHSICKNNLYCSWYGSTFFRHIQTHQLFSFAK